MDILDVLVTAAYLGATFISDIIAAGRVVLLYVSDALGFFKTLGLIGGTGQPVTHPGRAAVLAAADPMTGALLQKTPNDAGWTDVYTNASSLTGEGT